jgi:hypothetical protein
MKPLWLAMMLVTASVVAAEQAAPQVSKPAPPTRVPNGSSYRIYDNDGFLILNAKSGEASTLTGDCVQITCPPTFGKDIVCWVCKPRPEGSQRGKGAQKSQRGGGPGERFPCAPPLVWQKGRGCTQAGLGKG